MLSKNSNKMTKNQYKTQRRKYSEQLSIDEIDAKILRILMQDCRISSREIARKLNISVNTVIHRISKLEAAGIIKGYFANVDSSKLGYSVVVIIQVMMRKGMIREVEKSLSKFLNVCAVYDVTGDVDAIVVAKFKSTAELSEFVKSIQKEGYVERTETLVVLNIEKEDFRLL